MAVPDVSINGVPLFDADVQREVEARRQNEQGVMTAALRASLLQRLQELSAEDITAQSYTAASAAAGPSSSGSVPSFSGGPTALSGPSSGDPGPRYDLRSGGSFMEE